MTFQTRIPILIIYCVTSQGQQTWLVDAFSLTCYLVSFPDFHQRYQDRHEKRSRWIHLQFNLPYYPKISLAEGTGELIRDFHDVVWFLYLFSFFYVVKRSGTEYFQHWALSKQIDQSSNCHCLQSRILWGIKALVMQKTVNAQGKNILDFSWQIN